MQRHARRPLLLAADGTDGERLARKARRNLAAEVATHLQRVHLVAHPSVAQQQGDRLGVAVVDARPPSASAAIL